MREAAAERVTLWLATFGEQEVQLRQQNDTILITAG